MNEIKSLIKDMKITLEFGFAKVVLCVNRDKPSLNQLCFQVAGLLSRIEDPTNPINICQIASGMELLKELGFPDVLECPNFYSALYSYLSLCSKLESPNSAKHPESHWWWEMVNKISKVASESEAPTQQGISLRKRKNRQHKNVKVGTGRTMMLCHT